MFMTNSWWWVEHLMIIAHVWLREAPRRLCRAMRFRPLDVSSGFQLIALATYFWVDPQSIIGREAFSFVRSVDPSLLEWGMALAGASQIWAAMSDVRLFRTCVSFLVMWHWCSFAIGQHMSDPDASSVVLMVSAAVENLLIILCVV